MPPQVYRADPKTGAKAEKKAAGNNEEEDEKDSVED